MVISLMMVLAASANIKSAPQFDFDNPRLTMNERWQSMMSFVTAKGSDATEVLLKKSKDKIWYMRNAALVALDEINSPHAITVAKKFLSDESLVVRSAAVNVLQKHLTQDVRQLFWNELQQKRNFLKNQSLWIRSQIMEILSSHPLNSELKKFKEFRNDSDDKVSTAAKRAMDLISAREPEHLE